jgi:hypothetical protein
MGCAQTTDLEQTRIKIIRAGHDSALSWFSEAHDTNTQRATERSGEENATVSFTDHTSGLHFEQCKWARGPGHAIGQILDIYLIDESVQHLRDRDTSTGSNVSEEVLVQGDSLAKTPSSCSSARTRTVSRRHYGIVAFNGLHSRDEPSHQRDLQQSTFFDMVVSAAADPTLPDCANPVGWETLRLACMYSSAPKLIFFSNSLRKERETFLSSCSARPRFQSPS